jgi:phage baseplate assembly protein W
MSDFLGSGLAFPLRVDQRGGVALVHGEDDVAQAIAIILRTAPGERPMRPEFGCTIHDHIFDELDAATMGEMDRAVREAMLRWEPRIDVVGVDFDLTDIKEGVVLVDLTYRLRATNSIRNLVYPFYVIPEEGEPGGSAA